MIDSKLPNWFTALLISIGVLALVLSLSVITIGYPTLSLNIINMFVSIILFTIGLERVSSGLMLSPAVRQSIGITRIGRYTSIGIGSIAMIFAIVSLSAPQFAAGKTLTLLSLSISVIFNGFGKVVQGVLDKSHSTSVRLSVIALGILSVGVSILVGQGGQFGTIFLTRILSGVLILYGVQMIFFGITGRSAVQKMLEK